MSETFREKLNQLVTDKEVHTGSLYILSQMSRDSLAIFREVWPTIAPHRRRDIMQELVEISEVNFEVSFDPVFLLGMGDEDAEVRTAAINGLWEDENPDLVGPLLHLLRTDDTASVRAAAALSLGKYIYLGEIEKLNQAQIKLIEDTLLETIHLESEETEVRRRAIESIAYSSRPDITDIIEAAYYDDDEKIRVSAIFAMGRSADSAWRPRVIAELDSEDSEIRFEAARACGELEASDAVPRLVELIDEDPDLQVQEMAIWALGKIGGATAREALEIYLDSDIETIALAAEEALDELNLFNDSLDLFDFTDEDDEEWSDLDDDDFNGSNPSKRLSGGYLH
jgi:HEAT repeat protein